MKRVLQYLILIVLCISLVIAILYLMSGVFRNIEKIRHPIAYSDIVESCSTEYSVPEKVIYAVISVESSFEKDAVSSAGACGLMQLMPDTFIWLGEKNGEELSEAMIFDPEYNIKYGTMYLAMLIKEFGSLETALAAYNAGPTRVRLWLSDNEISADGKLVNIPIDETKYYINKVKIALAEYEELYS